MRDILTLAVSKNYTDRSILGIDGVLAGKNCVIESLTKANGRTTVVFKWTADNGTVNRNTMTVEDGTPIYVWTAGDAYKYGDLAIYESMFYRCITANSDLEFDDTKWNEIGSPDGNYDIVQNATLLPAIFTAADRKLYYSIAETCFYLWNGSAWVKQIDTIPTENSTKPITSGAVYVALADKVDKVTGKGLSANDYTNEAKQKVVSLGSASTKDYTSFVSPNNNDIPTSDSVYKAVSASTYGAFHPKGSKTCAELTSELLILANVGNVYKITDSGITTSDWICGAGHTIHENDNAVVVYGGEEGVFKFNLENGISIDMSAYQTKVITVITVDGTQKNNVEDALSAINTLSESNKSAIGNIKDGVSIDSFADVESALDDKADKSEMSVTDGIGADSDKTTIQLKNGTSVTVLKLHQDISEKADKVENAVSGNFASLDSSGNISDSGKSPSDYYTKEEIDTLLSQYLKLE